MAYSVKIDLHGQTVESARRLLTTRLKQLPDDVREVTVIHGYHGGTALQNFVRSYKNFRIERKILGLNDGETIFILK
jgi:DNA-nicking Smr family endonuclease